MFLIVKKPCQIKKKEPLISFCADEIIPVIAHYEDGPFLHRFTGLS